MVVEKIDHWHQNSMTLVGMTARPRPGRQPYGSCVDQRRCSVLSLLDCRRTENADRMHRLGIVGKSDGREHRTSPFDLVCCVVDLDEHKSEVALQRVGTGIVTMDRERVTNDAPLGLLDRHEKGLRQTDERLAIGNIGHYRQMSVAFPHTQGWMQLGAVCSGEGDQLR